MRAPFNPPPLPLSPSLLFGLSYMKRKSRRSAWVGPRGFSSRRKLGQRSVRGEGGREERRSASCFLGRARGHQRFGGGATDFRHLPKGNIGPPALGSLFFSLGPHSGVDAPRSGGDQLIGF
ncbi:hypothetical protein NL676_027824 [Syzygium grande]|nr:hypothetical protein NL676_027824 [Syzygium grande]